MPVVFSCDYGDYSHTMQAIGIEGDVQEEPVRESAYSHSGWAVPNRDREEDDEDEDEDEEDEKQPRVLVIR